MTVTIENIAPINLNVILPASGPPLRVYYSGTEVTDYLDDVFDESTPLSTVMVNVENDSAIQIHVQFDSLPSQKVDPGASIGKTMQMPDPGACTCMHITVWVSGQKHHDPIVRLKRKQGNITPSCTSPNCTL
jgi:hypothetical protein